MPTIQHLLLVPTISSLIFSALPVDAYIPAVPINDTSGLNLTDSSTISISWQNPAGVYSGGVSYQLQADEPTNGTTSGALVHFSESTMGPNLTTQTPWIAFISCDANETAASREWDIFTLARDRGAASALLYTTTSTSCLLNAHYIRDFEKPLDVFATKTAPVARVIENQFRHTNETYLMYNGTLLNQSGVFVNQSLAGATFNSTTYLIGTLVARNSTGQAIATDIPGATNTPSAGTSSGSSLPMIALYVVTSLVATAFLAMLILGWRRARRHPERYGRSEEVGEPPRTTAAGLAQAMLDTFPVIKFNRRNDGDSGAGDGTRYPHKRIESENELSTLGSIHKSYDTAPPQSIGHVSPLHAKTEGKRFSVKSVGTSESGLSRSVREIADLEQGRPASRRVGDSRPTSVGATSGVTSAIIPGHATDVEEPSSDTCPICLLEFEEGDDLRVLPCEREHMYHQACIDPWLLEISGSCPLCRKDFNAPPTDPKSSTPPHSANLHHAAGTSSSASSPSPPPTEPLAPPQNGFARYLAFMRGERNERRTRRRANTSSTAVSGPAEPEGEIYSVVWGTGHRAGPILGAGGGSPESHTQAPSQVGQPGSAGQVRERSDSGSSRKPWA